MTDDAPELVPIGDMAIEEIYSSQIAVQFGRFYHSRENPEMIGVQLFGGHVPIGTVVIAYIDAEQAMRIGRDILEMGTELLARTRTKN